MAGPYEYVYAHLPFCEVICHYCDFYTARAKGARYDDFFRALQLESKAARPNLAPRLKALYLGGGTPSAAPALLTARFVDSFRDHFDADTEVTLEANPVDITQDNLAHWRAAGVNRISLGIQSLDDSTLKRLGRVHDSALALRALREAAACFGNVSGDLIYGVPGQPVELPARHAEQLVEAGATHVSAYHLTLTPNHFLHPRLPDDKHAWDQIAGIAAALESLGLEHYEVSNFGRPGSFSRNNLNYWQGGPYWALGPSAHGFDGIGKRWKNVSDWEEYVRRAEAGEPVQDEVEALTLDQRRMEVLFTSLRTKQGLDLSLYERQFGQDLLRRHELLWPVWEKEGLGSIDNGYFVPTFTGRMLADSLVQKLL